MTGAYILDAVLVVYVLPVGFTMLYAWLFSSRTGVRFELSFAETSRNFRHVALFGSLFGILLIPADHFFPEIPAVSLYLGVQWVLLVAFTIRLSCQAVVLPLSKRSTGSRLTYGMMLATVILICQPAFFIAWALFAMNRA